MTKQLLLGSGHEPCSQSGMAAGNPMRDEHIDGLSNQLVPTVTEQLFNVGIYQYDIPLIVHEDNTAGRSFRRQSEELLGLFALRYIPDNAPDDQSLAIRADPAASTQVRSVHTAVPVRNPILALVIFTGSGRLLHYFPNSIAIIGMHSRKSVFQADVSRARQP